MRQGKRTQLEGVGDRLKAWRRSAGIRGFKLAEILRVSKSVVSDIENDKSLPSSETLAALHLYTSLNIGYLLTGKQEPLNGKPSNGGLKQVFVLTLNDDIDEILVRRNPRKKD